MQCNEVDEIIEAYAAGYLAEEPLHEFENHLRQCPTCADKARMAKEVLKDTGSFFESMLPQSDVEGRILQTVAGATMKYDKSWGDVMREQWERAPWWMISAAVHAVILMLMTIITVATAEKKHDDVVITTDLAKKKEPEYDENKVRDIFKNTKEVEAEEIVENPVFVHEEVEVTDHFETENEMETNTARGQEDAISDIPLGGTGVVGNIGVGGGGAGCFGYRTGGGRRAAVGKFGGSHASESAVDAALRWLARHQEATGRWDTVKYEAQHHGGAVDTGATGLATLAFLGAGHTERAGKFKKNVSAAIGWLIQQQKANGEILANGETQNGYHHSIGGLALAEAYGMARTPRTGKAAQLALDYSINIHQRDYDGWRYSPKSAGDTSVTGWFVMQLKSAKVAGLRVEGKGFSGAMNFVEKMTSKAGEDNDPYGGRVKYMGDRKYTQCMTSVGMVCRLFMGVKSNDPVMRGGADFMLQALPSWKGGASMPRYENEEGGVSFYYWYYGTLAMFQMGGDYWKQWNVALRDMLIKNQRKGGDEDGSWDVRGLYGRNGGRVYTTALGALCLEVYYRYLPMYKK